MGDIVRILTRLFHDQPGSWGAEETVDAKAALLKEDGEHRRLSSMRGQREGGRGWLVLTIFNGLLFTGAIILYAATWVKFSGRNYCLKVTSTYCRFSKPRVSEFLTRKLHRALISVTSSPCFR